MITPDASNTALLALVLSLALQAAGPTNAPSTALDPQTARELAVLARVLERRLGEVRASLPTASNICV